MRKRPAVVEQGGLVVHIICHYDDTNSSGGLDKQARLLTRQLKSSGENIVVLASTRKLSRAGWLADCNVPVRYFWSYTTPQVAGRHFPASLIWAAQLLLWIALNKSRIAVLHIHQLRIHAYVAALAGKWFRIPSVLKSATGGAGADIKTIGSRKYFGPVGRRFVARHGSIFVATTASVARDLEQHGVATSKVAVIPNGMQMPSEVAQRSERRSNEVVFLGRIARDKNVLSLVKAFMARVDTAPLHLDIWGKGPDVAAVQTLLQSRPAAQISYRGFASNTSELLPAYGWLILPSDAEGLSNAMIEAMAHGVVPVATRVSGCIDHIVDGDSGLFLEGVGPVQIGAGLASISSTTREQWSQMSKRVEEHARREFDIKSVVEAYRRLYRKLELARATRTKVSRTQSATAPS